MAEQTMNLEALSWAVEQEGLHPVDKLVLALISNVVDQNHSTVVWIQALSEATSLKKETVRRALERLCQRALIDLSDYTYPGFTGELTLKLKIGEELVLTEEYVRNWLNRAEPKLDEELER